MKKREYRVAWKRVGLDKKFRRFALLRNAQRFMLLFGPDPWKYYAPKKGPDSYECCTGQICACGGLTVREVADDARAKMPDLEYVRIESRPVGEWSVENL